MTDLAQLKADLDAELAKWWSLRERLEGCTFEDRAELKARERDAAKSVKLAQQRITAHHQNQFVRSAYQ